MRILLIRHVPVIEKIVMQKCASHQLPAAAGDMQPAAQSKTAPCYTQHMLVYCHVPMLDILPGPSKIPGSQNIRRVLFNLPLDHAKAIQFSFPLFCLPLRARPASFTAHRSSFLILKPSLYRGLPCALVFRALRRCFPCALTFRALRRCFPCSLTYARLFLRQKFFLRRHLRFCRRS